jgi:branched-chain amino acid transport system ATP-binding protein
MLSLRGITAGYGPMTVLRDVSLAVPDGRVVALVGPNGAGKTTLLRVAAGQIRPERGAVHLDGVDLTPLPPHRRLEHGVCLVPEGRGVWARLTVREHLRLYATQAGRPEAVDETLERFPRLAERREQAAGTMSGGEQQMLALARAFAARPRVVMLDEVSMGLAPKVVDTIFELLATLAATGTALLLVEQFVTRALALCDHVYLLQKGRVAFAGEPAEIDADALFASYVGMPAPAEVR